MKGIDIKATYTTPQISFNPEKGEMSITGRSIPDNCHTFFLPLLESLDKYSKKPLANTHIIIELEYFNTGTSKILYDFFQKVSTLKSNVVLEWRYEEEDEDMLESGQDFEMLSNIKFTFVVVDE